MDRRPMNRRDSLRDAIAVARTYRPADDGTLFAPFEDVRRFGGFPWVLAGVLLSVLLAAFVLGLFWLSFALTEVSTGFLGAIILGGAIILMAAVVLRMWERQAWRAPWVFVSMYMDRRKPRRP